MLRSQAKQEQDALHLIHMCQDFHGSKALFLLSLSTHVEVCPSQIAYSGVVVNARFAVHCVQGSSRVSQLPARPSLLSTRMLALASAFRSIRLSRPRSPLRQEPPKGALPPQLLQLPPHPPAPSWTHPRKPPPSLMWYAVFPLLLDALPDAFPQVACIRQACATCPSIL